MEISPRGDDNGNNNWHADHSNKRLTVLNNIEFATTSRSRSLEEKVGRHIGAGPPARRWEILFHERFFKH